MMADSITEARNKNGLNALYEIWTKKDNLAKAKGLCEYAEKCPAVSR